MTALLSNGTVTPIRGRAVVQPYRFTFTSSGITVQCRKISPTVMTAFIAALRKECQRGEHPEHPYPEVPKQTVDVAGEMVEQEVRGGDLLEQYNAQSAAWYAWANGIAGLRMLRMVAVDYIIANDEEVGAEVGFHRTALQRAGADLPDLDMDMTGYTDAEINRVYYLFCCCMLDQEKDTTAFMSFLMGRSQPREEAITDRIADFRAS